MHTKYCTDFLEWEKTKKNLMNDANYSMLAKKITKAIKFQLPDDGKILDIKHTGNPFKKYKEYIPVIKLPYDLLVMEFRFLDSASNPAPSIVLFEQIENKIMFNTLIKVEQLDAWVSLTDQDAMLVIDEQGEDVSVHFPPVFLANTAGEETSKHVLMQSIEILFSFLAALCCSNSDATTEIKVDEKLNKSRIKKGKVPYFSYKILTINTNKNAVVSAESTHKGNHASPRVHLRRGHIRRLPDKTVWVNACTVGNKAIGVIEKTYKVI